MDTAHSMRRALRPVAIIAAAALAAACAGGSQRDPEADAAKLADINLKLGLGYLEEGDMNRAVDRLRRSINVQPTSDAHLALAVAYDRLGQDDAADIQFREALRLQPDLAAAHTNYGSFLCKGGRVEEAEQQFRQAVSIPGYPGADVAYTNAALCVMRHGAPERADGYFSKALEVNPQFSPALLGMAERAFDGKDFAAARGYLERYLNVAPPSPSSLWLGVRIEDALGNRRGVATYAEQLTQRFPSSPEARQVQSRARRP